MNKNNKKSFGIMITALSAAIMSANGYAQKPDYDSLPISTALDNNAPFHVTLSDGQIHTIRLDALTPDQIEAAQKRAASFSPVKTSSSYTVTSTVPNINKFYGKNQVPPLNQKDFGTCVTFSSSAALSYLTTGTTNSVSPLYILDQGYIDENGFKDSGWDGLSNAGVLLQRLLPAYGDKKGDNQGYYANYDETRKTYDILSAEYALSGEQGHLTSEQLKKSGFDKQLNSYKSLSSSDPAILFTNVTASKLNLSEGSAQNAKIVKDALDKGSLVLMDFDVYDANVSSGPRCVKHGVTTTGTANYQFDTTTGILTQDTTAKTTNSWVNPTGCLLGGHQIWVISYATDKDGNVMFFIRNSWGYTGDQGQYYMSDSYLNNAVSYAAQVSLSVPEKNEPLSKLPN